MPKVENTGWASFTGSLRELIVFIARFTLEFVLIGGGALLLLGELDRVTADLDVVARIRHGTLQASRPFPPFLVEAIHRVGRALDLPHEPRDDPQRSRRAIDIADLQRLRPTAAELRHALGWCQSVDGRQAFLQIDAVPLLQTLGFELDQILHVAT